MLLGAADSTCSHEPTTAPNEILRASLHAFFEAARGPRRTTSRTRKLASHLCVMMRICAAGRARVGLEWTCLAAGDGFGGLDGVIHRGRRTAVPRRLLP